MYRLIDIADSYYKKDTLHDQSYPYIKVCKGCTDTYCKPARNTNSMTDNHQCTTTILKAACKNTCNHYIWVSITCALGTVHLVIIIIRSSSRSPA